MAGFASHLIGSTPCPYLSKLFFSPDKYRCQENCDSAAAVLAKGNPDEPLLRVAKHYAALYEVSVSR